MSVSPITTHILDTAKGCPAANVPVIIYYLESGNWLELGQGKTNKDGRVTDLLASDKAIKIGTYKIKFETSSYFQTLGEAGFYPYVEVVFAIENPEQHYHVPLLLSPFGYSTYRGS